MRVEVIYAEPLRVISRVFHTEAPITVGDALRIAQADPAFAGIELAVAVVGVFGKIAGRDQPLADGDRVEVYRPLAEDPKKARRARVHEARKMR